MLEDLQGQWTGTSQLWLDPRKPAIDSEATAHVTNEQIRYHWKNGDKAHDGVIVVHDEGIRWKDSFHQPSETELQPQHPFGALVSAAYAYTADPDPIWHWRIVVFQRPDGSLVIQMTNIPPWGEESPAARLVFQPTPAADLP